MQRARAQPALLAALVTGRLPKLLAFLHLLARRPRGAGLPRWRALDEIVRLDRRWFWAHPQRQHRCRWPETAELDLCDCDRGARLVMAIRHLRRGCLVYQPVIFHGALPASDESTAALITLAATSPSRSLSSPKMEVLARKSLAAPIRELVRSCAAARLIRVKPGHSEVSGGRRALVTFLSAFLAFGEMVGTSGQAAAEDFSRQRADLLNIAPERDAAVSDKQPRGEAGGSSWDLMRNAPQLDRAPAGTASEVGRSIEIANATSPGESVAAPVSGRVVFAAPFRSYGPLLIIQHGEYHTVLWGFTRLDVVVEDLVVKGQTLGFIGGEGGNLSILHIESRRRGRPVGLHEQFFGGSDLMPRMRRTCAPDSAAFAFCAGL